MPLDRRSSPPGRFDRTRVARILAAVLVTFAAVGLAAVLFTPDDPTGADGFGRQFVDACTRSGVDEDACRCALQRWTASVPEADLFRVDDELSDGESLPEPLRRELAACPPDD
jgi:hypothetical protein